VNTFASTGYGKIMCSMPACRVTFRRDNARIAMGLPRLREYKRDAVHLRGKSLADWTSIGMTQKRAIDKRRRADIGWLPAIVIAAGAVSGCSTDGMFGAKPGTAAAPTSPSFTDQFSDFFRGQPAKPAATATSVADEKPPEFDCPSVEVREGAGTYSVNASSEDQSALSLRYQATFADKARECHVASGMLTIKVGVRGRVILGPAGSPGDVVVPLRYALVLEGIEPKTIWTRFYTVPVGLPPGQTNVPFTHVMQDIVVPFPKYSEVESYVIYIGFDPNGLEAPKPAKPKPKAKPRARTSAAPSG